MTHLRPPSRSAGEKERGPEAEMLNQQIELVGWYIGGTWDHFAWYLYENQPFFVYNNRERQGYVSLGISVNNPHQSSGHSSNSN